MYTYFGILGCGEEYAVKVCVSLLFLVSYTCDYLCMHPYMLVYATNTDYMLLLILILTSLYCKYRRILTERHGYRIAVIMNEFGDTAVSHIINILAPNHRIVPFDILNLYLGHRKQSQQHLLPTHFIHLYLHLGSTKRKTRTDGRVLRIA